MFNIIVDPKVRPDMTHCLFCYENKLDPPQDRGGFMIPIYFKEYQELKVIVDNIKKCPRCNRLYILNG